MTSSSNRRVALAAAWLAIIVAGVAEPPAHVAAQQPAVDTGPEAVQPEAEPAYTVRGRCVDHADGSALAGVQVKLFAFRGPVAPPVEVAETTTNEQGEFEFNGLTPPNEFTDFKHLGYGLAAQAEGRASQKAEERFSRLLNQALVISIPRDTAALTGSVKNAAGEPVADAVVTYIATQYELAGRFIPGGHRAVTDADGKFTLDNLPLVEPLPNLRPRVTVLVQHRDYPATVARAPTIPAVVDVTLPTGCVVTGSVVDAATGQPASSVVVTVQNIQSGQGIHTICDAEGKFRLVVAEGIYNILAESHDQVSVALVEQWCRKGEQLELPPLKMVQGGTITGRVLNAKTGEPVNRSERGEGLTLGLFGPAQPPQKVIRPEPLAEVDDEGRFVLRAAPGENFPYFVNDGRGERMAWDTRKQAPIVVRAGEETQVDLHIIPRVTPEEKMQAAQKVLAALPAQRKQRVDQIIAEFRKLNHTVDETDVWGLLMRELVLLGKDAVPQLCQELDQTTEQRMLRRLGFALRAIGDPRAVPALIRAIPKTLQPPSSDYGLIVENDEVQAFMQQHDLDSARGGAYFGLGRPVREVFGALHKITGQDFEDATLYSVALSEDPQRQTMQRQLYAKQAARWQQWWEGNWQDFTDDQQYRLVGLSGSEELAPQMPITLRPGAVTADGLIGAVLSPASENGQHIRHFLDLDTRFQPRWPEHIPREESATVQNELAHWAAQQGVDLMCVTYQPRDGAATYALRAFNMRLWEISLDAAQQIEAQLRDGSLPQAKAAGELLLHYDKQLQEFVPHANAAFLYVTREGGMGLIEVTDRVTRVVDLTGLPSGGAPKGAGFHKGVRFNLKAIVNADGADRED